MTKKRVYISGAITCNPDYVEQFTSKSKELEERYTVLTPLLLSSIELDWKSYMKIDLAMIGVCDVVYVMRGWKMSRGAKIEEQYAHMCGKEVIYEED